MKHMFRRVGECMFRRVAIRLMISSSSSFLGKCYFTIESTLAITSLKISIQILFEICFLKHSNQPRLFLNLFVLSEDSSPSSYLFKSQYNHLTFSWIISKLKGICLWFRASNWTRKPFSILSIITPLLFITSTAFLGTRMFLASW